MPDDAQRDIIGEQAELARLLDQPEIVVDVDETEARYALSDDLRAAIFEVYQALCVPTGPDSFEAPTYDDLVEELINRGVLIPPPTAGLELEAQSRLQLARFRGAIPPPPEPVEDEPADEDDPVEP